MAGSSDVETEETELTDDVFEAMLNIMKGNSSQCNANIGYLTPAEIRLYTVNPRLYIRKIPQNTDMSLEQYKVSLKKI